MVIDPEQPGPGIITERDVLQSMGSGQDPNTELVRDHLSPELTFAAPDWSLERAAEAMVPRRLPPPRGGGRRRDGRRALDARHRALLGGGRRDVLVTARRGRQRGVERLNARAAARRSPAVSRRSSGRSRSPQITTPIPTMTQESTTPTIAIVRPKAGPPGDTRGPGDGSTRPALRRMGPRPVSPLPSVDQPHEPAEREDDDRDRARDQAGAQVLVGEPSVHGWWF